MNLNNTLYKIVLAGVFILPFFPLIIATSLFFPYITGKVLFFRLLVEIIFLAWLILLIRDRAYWPRPTIIFWSVLFWLIVVLGTALSGVNLRLSFFSNFERMEGVITYLHLGAYLIVIGSILNTKILWSRFFNTAIGASLLVVFYGLLQLSGLIDISQGGGRLDSIFGNSAYLASYTTFFIFIATLFIFRTSNRLAQTFYSLLILLYFFILYQTATRGAILGLIGGMFLVALLLAVFTRENRRLKRIAVCFLIVVPLLIASFWLTKESSFIKTSPVLSRFSDISLTEATTKSRFFVWQMAWRGFKERPILGWGVGNFQDVFNKYYDPRMYGQEEWFDRAHNVIFDWLIAGGILGLFSYILIYLALLYLIWRRESNLAIFEKSLLTGLIATYFFQNLFIFDNIVTYYLFFTILAFVHFSSQNQEEKLGVIKAVSLNSIYSIKLFIIFIGLILVLPIFYCSVFKPYSSASNLLNALVQGNQGEWETSLVSFEKVLTGSMTGRREAREQLINFTYRLINNPQIESEAKDIFSRRVILAIDEGISDNNQDARLYVFAGDFMLRAGQFNEALVYLTEALKLSPTKQSILLKIANAHLALGQTEQALKFARQAFELGKDFDQVLIGYAFVAFVANEDKLATDLLMNRFATLAVDNDLLLNFYVAEKRFDLVSAIWEKRWLNNQNDLEIWFSYAGSFLIQNKQREARSILEQALIVFADSPEAQSVILEGIEAIKSGQVKITK